MSFYLGQPEYAPSVAAEAERLKAEAWRRDAALQKTPEYAAYAAEKAALHEAAARGYAAQQGAWSPTSTWLAIAAALGVGGLLLVAAFRPDR